MKAYTDLEQSKKLAKILSIESADMYYHYNEYEEKHYPKVFLDYQTAEIRQEMLELKSNDPCWSLAALYDILPKFIGDYGKCLYYDVGGYYCGYMDDGNFMLTIQETKADNPVDACYEMIIKLHKRKML